MSVFTCLCKSIYVERLNAKRCRIRPLDNVLPTVWFHPLRSVSTGRSTQYFISFTFVCACICLFPFLLSYIPFWFLNKSFFKILRVDSGVRENINLRLTPSVKVISHLSPTLASCHVTKTASLSHSLALSAPTASITRAISLTHSLIALMEPTKSRRRLMQPV